MMKFDRVAQLDEVGEKRARLIKVMKDRGLDAILLTKRHNFSWASGGADNHVRNSSELGVATLLFYRDGRKVVLTSNIEAPRLMNEELQGLGFELKETRWYSPGDRPDALRSLLHNAKAASDDGTPGTEDAEPLLPWLRMRLTAHEQAKYRWLGRTTGQAMGEVCRKLARGMTEEEVAGHLFLECQKRGIKPSVMLVAADERIPRYRHPIPTPVKIKQSAMLIVCARRWGLIVSMTRLVHFGKLTPEIRRKHDACAYVDAVFIDASRAGVPLVDVFEKARAAYADRGFGDEWRLHHQGGPTGYCEREFTVNPETPREQRVENGLALAWNPSITGTKSEDTILATAKGPEVISVTPGWPTVKVSVGGKVYQRPDWLLKG